MYLPTISHNRNLGQTLTLYLVAFLRQRLLDVVQNLRRQRAGVVSGLLAQSCLYVSREANGHVTIFCHGLL